MKKLAFIFTCLFFISCATNNHKKKEEKRVTEVLYDFISAIQDKNFSNLDKLTSDDFVIYENGLVWDFEQFSLKLEEFESVKINYLLKDLHLIVDENTAHAQFHNQGTFVHPDTTIVLYFIESAVLVKENDKWQIKFYHSTHSK